MPVCNSLGLDRHSTVEQVLAGEQWPPEFEVALRDLLEQMANASHGMPAALVVVLDEPFTLLRFGEVDIEVGGEIAVGGRSPGEGPAHSALVGLQFRQWCAGYRHQAHVVVRQVDDDGVEAIGDGGAGRAAGRVVGAEHEVVDQQLRASLKEFGQGGAAVVGIEAVRLVEANPRQCLATSSLRRVRAFSASSSCRRAASHWSRDAVLWVFIVLRSW